MTHVFSRSRVASAVAVLAISIFASEGAYADDAPGAVYTMNNAAAGNSILIFDRAASGVSRALAAWRPEEKDKAPGWARRVP